MEQHKLYTGDDYIRFTTHMDLDIYVMYDTRGGVDRFDNSNDAPWLSQEGFTADMVTSGNPQPTRYFRETTDTVQYYAVYRNNYPAGEEVRLHGNRKGVTEGGINTSYRVLMKRMDVFEKEPAAGDPGWLASTQVDYILPAVTGTYQLYTGTKMPWEMSVLPLQSSPMSVLPSPFPSIVRNSSVSTRAPK